MRARLRNEDGAIAVITAIVMVVVFIAGAMAVDIGDLIVRRQTIRNALDSAVLAGAALLPADPVGAKAIAITYALENDSSLTAQAVNVDFRCLIGETGGGGSPDLTQVPAACNPGADGISAFACDRGLCMAPCAPSTGDVCNTIVSAAARDVPFKLAPVAGVNSGSTGVVQSAACSGYCGSVVKIPIDIGLIVDRTASMSSADLANAKQAAEAVLGFFDPVYDHVALGVINRSSTSTQCTGGGFGRSITTTDYAAGRGTWIAAPYPSTALADDYQRTDGSLNPLSTLVKTVRCLQTSNFSASQGQTDIGSPIAAMTSHLNRYGRAGVKKVIVAETDGEANLPPGTQPCGYAATQADGAKRSGIEVFTIGFGIGGKRCIQDLTGGYRNGLVTKLLADAATQPSFDNGCVAAENSDGDHFFCEPRGTDLRDVFLRVASAITAKPRLVRLVA